MQPEDIYCEGCMTPGNPKLIDNKCPVRPCVIEKGFDNCSKCDKYPCNIFNQRKVVHEDFAKDKDISEEEYVKCIKPYENVRRFDEIKKEKTQ